MQRYLLIFRVNKENLFFLKENKEKFVYSLQEIIEKFIYWY